MKNKTLRLANLSAALFMSLVLPMLTLTPGLAAGGGDLMDGEGQGKTFDASVLSAKVKIYRDLAYGRDTAQKIDVYAPPNARSAPIIFMVHGGAWLIGDKTGMSVVKNKVEYWVPKGYIFVSVNYRMVPKADPIEQANDVARALAFVQANAKTWGGDPQRCILMGHSAGAHLVAMLASDPSIAAKQGANDGWIGTVSLDSAAMDVVDRMKSRHQKFWDQAFGSDPNYWREASPIYRLTAAPFKPMLLICSTLRPFAVEQSEEYAKRATALGGKVTLMPVAMKHAEINEDLGLPSDYTEKVDAFMTTLH